MESTISNSCFMDPGGSAPSASMLGSNGCFSVNAIGDPNFCCIVLH